MLKRLTERYPHVQLATLVDRTPGGDGWLHEIKFDGYRLLGFVAGDSAELRTRNGKDWTDSFPTLVEGLQALKVRDAVVDMEAVVQDAEGKSSFQALQMALGKSGKRSSIVAYVFDLLCLEGKDLTAEPLVRRKEKLRKLLTATADVRNGPLRYSDHVVGNGEEMFRHACAKGLEGIICKKADAPYRTGRRPDWLKVKCGKRQEFIILGFSPPRSGERAFGALYLGYREDGALRYAGKVGTGFTMQAASDLLSRFKTLSVEAPLLTRKDAGGVGPGELRTIRWVKPVLICEVAFTEWTTDGRIRHPSFQGLRGDKGAAEVIREAAAATDAGAVKGSKPRRPAKQAKRAKAEERVVAGVTITHPDRVISSGGGVTKGDLAEYYGSMAPLILSHVARKPVSVLRCPSGIDGECFFQRNPGPGLGGDVRRFEFRREGKRHDYIYVEDEKGLLQLIQMGGIELHPWGASIDAIDYPDRLIFDLDPAPDVPFAAVRLAARDIRRRLQHDGLESTLKCTGGKGLHVTVPLAGKDPWPVVKTFAQSVATEMAATVPKAYVATMSKAKRTGRIFVDYFRNDYTATAIADYSVRARPGAPVAVPLEWSELARLKSPSQFSIADVLRRMKRRKPPSSPVGQRIPVR